MEIIRSDNSLLLQDASARTVGRLDYVREDATMVIRHVGVDEALRGQGLAKRLVRAAVALAREEGLKIVPVCPYAQAVLRRDASVADVLA